MPTEKEFRELNAHYWLDRMKEEVTRATAKHGSFHSAHEGYAVMLEEVDELWAEIKKKSPDLAKLQEEAVQVGAMAARFIADVTATWFKARQEKEREAKYLRNAFLEACKFPLAREFHIGMEKIAEETGLLE